MSIRPDSFLPDDPQGVDEALCKAGRALSASLDVNDVCHGALDAVGHIFGATSSWLLLHDPERDELITHAFRGKGAAAYQDVRLPVTRGILGLAFRSREVVFVADAQREQRWFDPDRVHRAGLRSVFTVPLLHADRVVGVLGLDTPRVLVDSDGDAPAVDIARLQALAAQTAVAISNARMYEASERDRRRLARLLQERRAREEAGDAHEACAVEQIVAASEAFQATLHQVTLVAPGDTTVLLLGETGTGKELLARLIHERSARAKAAFVAVNCAALPETLVESELFGHEKGAFTGALLRKPGKFEIADGGTLFLDEIGDLPAAAQAKLLRVLQNAEVHRVGALLPVHVNVRVIAATNQDLEQAILEKRFRADLYYRLSVFPLALPPLRERAGDVEALSRHFVRLFAAKLRKPVQDIDAAALDRLRAYHWPGNVRELQNVIERALILSRGTVLTVDTIAIERRTGTTTSVPAPRCVMTLADAERHAIRVALEEAKGRISGPGGAAELLALPPTTLHAKMKKLGLRRSPT